MRVALTFDAEHPDRPRSSSAVAGGVLDVLAARGLRATFFLQGRWARAHPEVSERIAGGGHLLGSHSFFHARLPLLSDGGLDFDLREAERWIRAVTGRSPRPWFRLPWGDGAADVRVKAALEERGFLHVGWDVVAEDWEETRTAARVEEEVVEATLQVGDGAVVLLHAWPASTLAALPGAIDRLRAQGARFVTVAEIPDRDLGGLHSPPFAAANPRG